MTRQRVSIRDADPETWLEQCDEAQALYDDQFGSPGERALEDHIYGNDRALTRDLSLPPLQHRRIVAMAPPDAAPASLLSSHTLRFGGDLSEYAKHVLVTLCGCIYYDNRPLLKPCPAHLHLLDQFAPSTERRHP